MDFNLIKFFIDEINDAAFLIDPETSRIIYANSKGKKICSSIADDSSDITIFNSTFFNISESEWIQRISLLKNSDSIYRSILLQSSTGNSIKGFLKVRYFSVKEKGYILTTLKLIGELSDLNKDYKIFFDEEISLSEIDKSNNIELLKKFKSIWNSSPVGICLLDKVGKFIIINPAFCNMYGYSEEELLERNFFEIIIQNDKKELFKQTFLNMFESGVPGFSLPHRKEPIVVTKKKSGELFHVEYIVDFIREDESPMYAVIFNIDVSERIKNIERLEIHNKKLEELNKKIEAANKELIIKDKAISSSISGFAISDLKGNVTYVNKAIIDMWGFENESEIVGKHYSLFFVDTTADGFKE